MPYTKFVSRFTDYDIFLFKSGRHYQLHEKLGSHQMEVHGEKGTYFALWAPNAKQVSVIGDFNQWQPNAHLLHLRHDGSGIWEGFVPSVRVGALYKYRIVSNIRQYVLEKADPFAHQCETPPQTAAIVWQSQFGWSDDQWMQARFVTKDQPKPMSVYEVHLGSWRRKSDATTDWYSYAELGELLVNYVKDMGFTHVELMPIAEHPYYPSWGYQQTGYFAPSSRYGSPDEFKHLVNAFHQAGIGVILDWVPSHFPDDAHGLARFDGTHLYEHPDPRKGYHPDWKSLIFNYERQEVRAFLISSAMYWLEEYHLDGLRVDAVASMLYADYSRKHGEWMANKYGGNSNLEAIDFLKELNGAVQAAKPDVLVIAEESTAWQGVSHPIYQGGLGFNQKWMMGWMHDTLNYFKRDPAVRQHHQGGITFSLVYAFAERFMLPLSHDEVVYGKGSLFSRMPGEPALKAANLRLMLGFMFAHPGTQLLFMGGEFGQVREWNCEAGLDWHLLEDPLHKGVQDWVRQLNFFLKKSPALYEFPFDSRGFEWISADDHTNCVVCFLRKGSDVKKAQVIVCNFKPNTFAHYRIGVPMLGNWREVLNSNDPKYGGNGILNAQPIAADQLAWQNQRFSMSIRLSPMSMMCFELENAQ